MREIASGADPGRSRPGRRSWRRSGRPPARSPGLGEFAVGLAAAVLAGLALGPVPRPALAADVTASALRRMCGDQAEPMASIGCEAYVDGFVTGLARAGAVCPPGSAARDLRRGLLAAPPESLAGPASDYLLEAARRGYPCPAR